MSKDTEEKIPEKYLFDITKIEFYDTLKGLWKRPILYLLLAEGIATLIALVLYAVIKFSGVHTPISLPAVDIGIAPLDSHRVAITLFQSAITVSGIIVGFFAVCFFFMLDWTDRVCEDYAERIRKERNPKRRSDLRKRRIHIEGATAGLTQYANLFVENAIPIMVVMAMFFFYSLFSGVFVLLNIILDFNSVYAIAFAIYPLIRFIFVFRESERKLEESVKTK